MVAIDHPTTGIHRQHPVGIAIERKSHGSSSLKHRPTQRLQLGGPTIHIDSLAIGLPMEHRQVST